MALINIEPGWDRMRAQTLDPPPDFIRIGDPAMHHLQLVGFSLSMRCNRNFRHITILVLGDLDKTTAPTMADLYGVLFEATWLEALWVGKLDRTGESLNGEPNYDLPSTDPLAERKPLILRRLNKLHFFAGGNKVFDQLLSLLQAPTLDILDVRLMDERDWSSLLGCADLVRPVKALRIYGVCKSDLDLVALSILMPEVTVLDVTTADRALARCATMAGFRWTKVSTLRLRNPRTESIRGILAAVAVGNLRIHYPFPAKMLSRAETEWISTKVETVVLTVEWAQAWYATTR
jgi:hypothetical protein